MRGFEKRPRILRANFYKSGTFSKFLSSYIESIQNAVGRMTPDVRLPRPPGRERWRRRRLKEKPLPPQAVPSPTYAGEANVRLPFL